MPLIQVTMIEGRTAEQKHALLAAITQAVHETIGAPVDSIRAWVTDVPGDQFMTAGVLASDRQDTLPGPPPAARPLDAAADVDPGSPLPPPIDPITASSEPGVLP